MMILRHAHGVIPFRITLLAALLAVGGTQNIVRADELRLASAKEQNLETAGAAYAPMDASKHADPIVPLTMSQRQELLEEFKGLVHLGLRNVAYDHWEGKEMADCDTPREAAESWSRRCEIMTGQGDGTYYFYPSESRRTATLQHLDIRVDGADEKLLDDFRRPVQELFGKASVVQKPTVRAKATGVIRHWNTGTDIAELFIDHSVRPEGSVRFVWMRSPLIGGQQAKEPANTDN